MTSRFPRTVRGRLRRLGINYCVDLSLGASKPFGAGPYVSVVGTARSPERDVTFHTTLVPRGEGAYRVFLDGEVREAAALVEREPVVLELAPDAHPPEPPPPDELLAALDIIEGGIEAFFALPDGLRREALRFIIDAKRATTRERRVVRIVELVEERLLRDPDDEPATSGSRLAGRRPAADTPGGVDRSEGRAVRAARRMKGRPDVPR